MNLSDYELWNVYFPPFQAAVQAGAGNVMTAYMDLNGVPASGSRWLFTEVLREAWGFRGFVVSDANAVRNLVTHGFAVDLADAGARAVAAGVDMEMAMADPAYAHLPDALQSGAVAEDVIDARVRTILEAKLRLGLFDAPYVDEDRAREVLADPEHREVARVAAERSAVLLRNEGGLLPLAVDQLGSLAVVGPLAASRRDTLGPWVFDFDLDETVTVLDGIRGAVGEGVRVDYAPGVPVVQRVFPSMFDMFGGNRPADPEGFDEEVEFARARDVAAARGRCDRRRGGVAEHDRRGRLAVVDRAAGPATGVGSGSRGHRHTHRAAGDERAAARPALGGGERAGDPGHLVPRHAGRRGGREPAVRGGLSRREAAVHLAADRRAGPDDLLAHHLARAGQPAPPLLGRSQHTAVPLRVRVELRPASPTPTSRSTAGRAGRDGAVTVSVG